MPLIDFKVDMELKWCVIDSLNSNNLNITTHFSNMQRLFCPITPQKRTFATFNCEGSALKELSPLPNNIQLSSQRKNAKL
jgi:hypothetical protein